MSKTYGMLEHHLPYWKIQHWSKCHIEMSIRIRDLILPKYQNVRSKNRAIRSRRGYTLGSGVNCPKLSPCCLQSISVAYRCKKSLSWPSCSEDAKMRFRLGLRPGPRWKSSQRSSRPPNRTPLPTCHPPLLGAKRLDSLLSALATRGASVWEIILF